MLVLSRRESQRITLGESIVVTVIRVSGDTVRLGIEAPAEVPVLRGELSRWEPSEIEAKAAGQLAASRPAIPHVERRAA